MFAWKSRKLENVESHAELRKCNAHILIVEKIQLIILLTISIPQKLHAEQEWYYICCYSLNDEVTS